MTASSFRRRFSNSFLVIPAVVVIGVLFLSATVDKQYERAPNVQRSDVAPKYPERSRLIHATSNVAVIAVEPIGQNLTKPSVSFEFVNMEGEKFAKWSSSIEESPRLICAECPKPIVGNSLAFFEFDDGEWKPIELQIQRPKKSDIRRSTFGIDFAKNTGFSFPVVYDLSGKSEIVIDGTYSFRTEPFGIEESVTHLNFFESPIPQFDLTAQSVSFDSGGNFFAIRRSGIDQSEYIAQLNKGGVRKMAFKLDYLGEGFVSACSTDLNSSRYGFLVGTNETKMVKLYLLNSELQLLDVKDFSGSFESCFIDDRIANIWTGSVSGEPVVDISKVKLDGSIEPTQVKVAGGQGFLLTLLDNRERNFSLQFWPSGGRAQKLWPDGSIRQINGFGGGSIIRPRANVAWVWFEAVRSVLRFE